MHVTCTKYTCSTHDTLHAYIPHTHTYTHTPHTDTQTHTHTTQIHTHTYHTQIHKHTHTHTNTNHSILPGSLVAVSIGVHHYTPYLREGGGERGGRERKGTKGCVVMAAYLSAGLCPPGLPPTPLQALRPAPLHSVCCPQQQTPAGH